MEGGCTLAISFNGGGGGGRKLFQSLYRGIKLTLGYPCLGRYHFRSLQIGEYNCRRYCSCREYCFIAYVCTRKRFRGHDFRRCYLGKYHFRNLSRSRYNCRGYCNCREDGFAAYFCTRHRFRKNDFRVHCFGNNCLTTNIPRGCDTR